MSNKKFCIKRTEGNYDIVNDFFNKVYLDSGSVTWPNGFDFCSVFLRDEA